MKKTLQQFDSKARTENKPLRTCSGARGQKQFTSHVDNPCYVQLFLSMAKGECDSYVFAKTLTINCVQLCNILLLIEISDFLLQ